MKTFSQNANALLFERAKTLSENHNSWKCIQLNLSAKHEQYSYALRTHFFAKPIAQLLADTEGYIYLCEDGDIIILFQGPFKPIGDKLAERYGDLEPQRFWDEPEEKLFALFDLSMDWHAFHTLCKDKAIRTAYRTPAAMSFMRPTAARLETSKA